jgi:hypothetical protein
MQTHDPVISWRKNTLTFASSHCRQTCGVKRRIEVQGIPREGNAIPALDICMIGAAPFARLAGKARRAPKDYTVFAVTLQDIEKALAPKVTIELVRSFPRNTRSS